MFWLLSFLPRRTLQRALFWNWRRSLPSDQRIRLDYWGAAGCDTGYHPFQWADDLPAAPAVEVAK